MKTRTIDCGNVVVTIKTLLGFYIGHTVAPKATKFQKHFGQTKMGSEQFINGVW